MRKKGNTTTIGGSFNFKTFHEWALTYCE